MPDDRYSYERRSPFSRCVRIRPGWFSRALTGAGRAWRWAWWKIVGGI